MGQFSPRQVALFAALLVATVGCAVLVIIADLLPGLHWSVRGLMFFALLFLLAYGIFSFGIGRFINNRINLLYRTVHDLRRTPKDKEDPVLRGDVIGQVNTEVAEWATERAAEIKELQQREAFRREFIGNLAHELKTPIFNIQGYILTLLEGGLEDQKVNRDFLKRASNGVDRLMKIVEDLDMITKLESGVMDLRITRMDLNEVVSESIASMEILAKEKDVRLINELGPQLLVKADRNRMVQVFINLFNNAINYGKPGGTCTVRSFPLDDNVLVEVTDNGIGISEEHLPRLFERFYRVGKSRARNEGGSGLGLAIVKHIIDVHGGTISVKSVEGKGTTFNFTLRKAP
ncbi:MAG: sensor histidine kinase [Flavobacteriales bacterium]|nr:sensor histidine kinase [Flavobacteriales bacterium]MBP7156350.1 sensor histidine kinase [Flavobacteriales bacterium]HQV74945.1 ATP-binding protein [Flavobacteriales bacterium]HQW41324.1 ATP-binding protein [Flavobacteriales bacterium]